ncbi:MAG: DUF1801 domain-containing protein [Chitinophagaceae bacterium]|jgi:uncharacterized protein YdhG (YjbR/CyaY superfamily)|nr:DUF1801 domain-containing protein [Chitinophagaceae bacterium]
MATQKSANIDEYIAGFPKEIQMVLEQVRSIIKKEAPGAEETISYAIPAFNLHKHNLIYFAGYKNHISLYPVPKGTETFTKEISKYKSGKGTMQFPLDKPLPVSLVTKIIKYSIKENIKKYKQS